MSLWRQLTYGLRTLLSRIERATGRLPMRLSSISSKRLLI